MELLVSRKIDDMGRIVLPGALRKKVGWNQGDTLNVYQLDNNTVILQVSEKSSMPCCVICGKAERGLSINGADICKSCLMDIRE